MTDAVSLLYEKLERKLRKARRPKDIAALIVQRALGSQEFARDFQAALRFIPVITRNRRYLLSLAPATRRVWLKEAWKAQGGVRSRDPRLARIVVNAAMAALRVAPTTRKGK